ncbi:Thiol-disulfide oxidoreductase [Tenacibaculum maritimum]|uniref:TlpA family protein disulfide reductase n=1 Tax=Tenacibaculum maritimum TaxID=107401 RepID=UPI0012E6A95D|nr:TlpA disulfide reductase family protein [Tenacibaculum maritimum]CAA0169256.1 Thiol-disulfide oxidoreductase [Tenacibaculum maritimum]
MKINSKKIINALFLVFIILMIYPPTKVYFIRLVSFAPSEIEKKAQKEIGNYQWSLKGLNAPDINFEKVKGKVVFINFWATWCPPCIAEMPSIQKLYGTYKEKITFLFISNEKWEVINKFYKEKGYDLPTYHSVNQIPSKLEATSIPTTYIINQSGKIVVAKQGSANWNSKSVKRMLDKLLAGK